MPIESKNHQIISKKTLILISGAIILVAGVLGFYAFSQSQNKNKSTPDNAEPSNQIKETANSATIPDPKQPSENKPVEPTAPQVNTPSQAVTEPKSTKTSTPTTVTEKPKTTPATKPETTNNTNSTTPSTSTTKPTEPINTPTVPLNEDRGAFDF